MALFGVFGANGRCFGGFGEVAVFEVCGRFGGGFGAFGFGKVSS